MQPVVSIIIPVYNVRKYLKNCLESVARQTLDGLEVIVVDDGSNDGSEEIAIEFVRNHKNFNYIRKENGGLMSAWTLGVRKSTGEYIGFVDSDDVAKPDMFHRLYDSAVRYDADIVYCDFEDNTTGNVYSPEAISEGLYTGSNLDVLRGHVFPVPQQPVISNARWNKLFRRNIIIDNLIYTRCQSRTFEDRYIVPAAIMSAKRFFYLKESLYIYTVNRDNSNSKQYKPDLLEQIKRFYEIQGTMLDDKGLKASYRTEWESVFIDYIRQYVTRNIVGVCGFTRRIESARCLFDDDLVKKRLDRYGYLFGSRLGHAVNLSYRLKSPALLAVLSYLA